MCLLLILTELGTLNDHCSCSCGKLLNFIEEWKSWKRKSQPNIFFLKKTGRMSWSKRHFGNNFTMLNGGARIFLTAFFFPVLEVLLFIYVFLKYYYHFISFIISTLTAIGKHIPPLLFNGYAHVGISCIFNSYSGNVLPFIFPIWILNIVCNVLFIFLSISPV